MAEHCLHCYALLEDITQWRANPFVEKIVSQYGPERIALLLLLHDAHEAYTKDFPTGLKPVVPGLVELQGRADAAIFKSFGVDSPSDKERELITVIDRSALIAEARLLMPTELYHWIVRRIQDEGPAEVDTRALAPKVWRNAPDVEATYKDEILSLL